MQGSFRWFIPAAACLLALLAACDEEKKPAPAAPAAPPTTTQQPAAETPRTMPQVSVFLTGVSLGIDQMPFSTPSFDVSFRNMLKRYPVSEPDKVVVTIDRKVKTPVASKIFYMLIDAGAKRIEVHTKPRGTFPDTLVIGSERDISDDIPGCTYIGMVLSDLGAAFWKKQGGLAKRYTKGMAGPDFSAMHEVMHKEAKTCNSKVFLFSAAADIDWGHAFDTAGSVKAADPAYENISELVLLRNEPVPGKPVKINAATN